MRATREIAGEDRSGGCWCIIIALSVWAVIGLLWWICG